MKKLILLFILAITLTLDVFAESYVTTHSKMVSEWTIVLPAVVNGRAFVSPGLALEVVDVRIDGVSQRPTEGGVAREDGSLYPLPVEAVVYQLCSDCLDPNRWKEGKIQEGPLLKYSLPCTAKRIDIRYIIHLRNGSSSKEITLTSFELNALEGREPNQSPQPTRPTGG